MPFKKKIHTLLKAITTFELNSCKRIKIFRWNLTFFFNEKKVKIYLLLVIFFFRMKLKGIKSGLGTKCTGAVLQKMCLWQVRFFLWMSCLLLPWMFYCPNMTCYLTALTGRFLLMTAFLSPIDPTTFNFTILRELYLVIT